tara:strand:- start:405 stop:1472 length:1068 start_codon:yes stop_codon:yes gene_type:complete
MSFLVLTTPFLRYDRERLIGAISSNNYLDIIAGIFLKFISSGHFAVVIFFVVSGYALSVGNLDLVKRKLALSAASRYFRLMIPILITSLIAYLLLKLNLMFNLEVATTPEKSSGWLGTFYKFDASIEDVIMFSFYDVFFKYDSDKTYNSILWIMQIEIAGSFMIYAYLAIFRATEKIHWKVVLPLTTALFVAKPLLSCFLIGYIIAEINKKYNGDYLLSFLKIKNIEIFFISLFLISATLSTYFRSNDYEACFLASCIVLSVSFSRNLKSFFSNRLSNYLGRISFPLYLIQTPIICSWSSFLYLKLPALGFDMITSNLINLFSTVALSLLSATLLLPIEKLSIIYSKKIARVFIN